ncbi:retrovirus-related pol polyprotein from transposon TNT 1-94 [Tanacetum coccineum]
MLCVMNSTTVVGDSVNSEMQSSESCDKCSDLDAELLKQQNANNELLKTKDTTIRKLKEHIKSMRENKKENKLKQDMDEIEAINIELEHNQFDLVKKKRALSKEHCDSLIAQMNSKSMENADLKGQIKEKGFATKALQNELRRLKGKNVLDNATNISPVMFKLDLDRLASRLLKNTKAHIDYLKYTQEQADILLGIVEQAKAKQPLDNALDFACKHAKGIQELLVYVRDTCLNVNKPSEKLIAVTPLNKFKKVRFYKRLTSSRNIHKQVESSKTLDSNTHVLPSTGLKSSTSASRSQPTDNKKNDKISQTPSSNMKNKVEVQLRRANLSSDKKNHVKDPICDANVKHIMLNVNSELICVKCKQCMFDANHDVCFLDYVNDVNVRSKSNSAKQSKQHNIWKPTANLVPPKETTSHSVETQKPEIKFYSRRPKQVKYVGSSKKSKYIESKIANNSEPNHSWGSNAIDVPSSSSLFNDRFSRLFSGTVRTKNDQIAKIIGYGDYQLGNVTISRKNNCFIRDLDGVDLLSGSKDTNLYTISLYDMLKTSHICLLSKALNTKSWLWHHRLSYLNFSTLNKLAKDGLARGIPKLKFKKDHMCSACALSKCNKSSHQPKAKDTNQEKLYLLHMDLYGPMRIENINGKIQVAATPRAVDIADSLVSTSIDQDAPSTSIPSTQKQEQSLIISQGVEESPKTPHFNDDPLHETLHDDSTSQGSSSNV